jgi:peptidoglycan hydrolase CwlO-like protein
MFSKDFFDADRIQVTINKYNKDLEKTQKEYSNTFQEILSEQGQIERLKASIKKKQGRFNELKIEEAKIQTTIELLEGVQKAQEK